MLATMWVPDLQTMRLVLPELLLVATLVVLLVWPILFGRDTRTSGLIALLGAIAAAVAAGGVFPQVADGGVELFGVRATALHEPGPGMLAADRLGAFFRLLLMVFLVAVLLMWLMFDAPSERSGPEFMTLLVASALGMALMAESIHLLIMIIAIELASMPSFALAGFDRHRPAAAEAAVKYTVFGAATSGFMIFGASLLYGLFGTLHVPTMVQRMAAVSDAATLPILVVALLAVFAGVAFKISAVPSHFWCPDVFEGASLPVAMWLSVASKAAGIVLLVRLVGLCAVPGTQVYEQLVLPTIQVGVGVFAILTCTVANLAAYGQSNVRRLLAYSSIAHAGYMLCAGAVVQRADAASAAAMSAVVAYLAIYLFMNLGAFMVLGLVARDTGREDMDAFTGLGWREPSLALSLTICLVSLIGLPPLGGFIVKWWLIYSLGSAAVASPFLWVVVGAVVLNTALSLYYYARIIRQTYLRGIELEATEGLRAPLGGKLIVHLCALVLLLTGTLLIPPLKNTADFAAERMYAGVGAERPFVVKEPAGGPRP